MLQTPPVAAASSNEVTELLATVGAGVYAVEVLPHTVDDSGSVVIDSEATERLVRDFVPYPAASELANRLQVSVLTRTTSIDPAELATTIAGHGVEIVSIGNAGAFDDGATQLLAPFTLQDEAAPLHDDLFLLRDDLGADIVWADEFDESSVVTLIAGPDIRVEF